MIIDSPIISGSLASTGSLNQIGNVVITGSLTVTGPIAGSITGSADSASFATTASYAVSASHAERVDDATSASYAVSASHAERVDDAISSSYAVTSSYSLSGSYSFGATSASYAASSTSASYALNSTTASYAVSSSQAEFADDAISSSYAVSSSYSLSGSYAFGATSASYALSASHSETTDDAISSSYALSASYALSSSYAANADLLDGRDSLTYANTGSNTFTNTQYINAVNNAVSFTSTASLYTDGGVRVTKDMYVSGTAYFNNVTVYGTQSISYISSSQLNIGTNLISVNTDTPTVRFGGLAVYDSGSTGLSGSLLWDSEDNHWVYSNPSGSTYDGGMLISGPRNTSGLGNEVGTTACAVIMGQGGDHITSSAIFHYGNATCFYGNSYITSSGGAYFSGNVGVGLENPIAKLEASKFQGHGLRINYCTDQSVSAGTACQGGIYAVNCGLNGYPLIVDEVSSNVTGGQYPVLIRSLASAGTPAAGMATGIHFGVPDNASNVNVAQMAFRTTDADSSTYTMRWDMRMKNSGSYQTNFIMLGDGSLALGTNGTAPSYRLDVSGCARITGDACIGGMTLINSCLGVGTSSPNTALEVNKTITFSNVDTYAQLVVKTTSGANGKLLNIGVDETNCISFIQSLNRGIDTMPLVLQRYGSNVGIGCTAPSDPLTIGGGQTGLSINSQTTGDPYIRWRKDGTIKADAYVDRTTEDLYIRTSVGGSGALQLGTVGNTRLTIASTGIACFACQVCAPSATLTGALRIGTTSGIDGNGESLAICNIYPATGISMVSNCCVNHYVMTMRNCLGLIGTINTFGYDIFYTAASATGAFVVQTGGAEKMRITSAGDARFSCSILANNFITICNPSSCASLILVQNPANATANTGGEITFAATYRATADYTEIARIRGLRENSTSGTWAGYLAFYTSPGNDSPSASTERMRITSTGVTCFACQICTTSAALSGNVILNRANTSAGNNIEWRTASTLNWYIGTRGLVNNSFYFVNEGLGANNLILDATTGVATFACSVTANGSLTINEDGGGTKVLTVRSDWAGVDPAINVTTNNCLLLMTNNTVRVCLSNTGIATFACQVCAPTFLGSTATLATAGTACTVSGVLTLATLQTGGASVCAGAAIVFEGNAGATVARIYSRGNMNFNNGSDLVFQTQVSAGGTPQCTMVINGATQRVGIGYFNPSYTLHVNGSIGANGIEMGGTATSPSTAFIGYGMFGYSGVGLGISAAATGANQGMGFFTCGDYERMRLVTNGDLWFFGKATTSNYQAVFYNDNAQLAINATNTSTGKAINFNPSSTFNAFSIAGTGIACFACQVCAPRLEILRSSANNGLFVYSNSGATPIGCTMAQINGLTNDSTGNILTLGSLNDGIRTVFRNDGNVGIGTSTPAFRLHVHNTSGPSVVVNSVYNCICSVWNSSDGSIVFFGAITNHPLQLITNDVTRLTITSAGAVAIRATCIGLSDIADRTLLLGSRPGNADIVSLGFDVGGTWKAGFDYKGSDGQLEWWTNNGSWCRRIMYTPTGMACFSNTICAPIGIFSTCVGINVTSPDAPLRIHGGAGSTSTVIIAGGAVGNDNATISAPYSMVFQVDNTGGVGGRSFSFKCGGKGYSDGTTLLAISSTGNVTPGANGTQDLGSSSLRWCTVYTSDLSLNNGIGNYTIVEGENDLFLYNNNSCKVFKFLLQEVCPEIAPAKRSI